MGDSSPIATLCLRRRVVPVQIGLLSCSGLLIHPALFVLTPFHLYRTTYEALSCTELPHLQTKVHQVRSERLRTLEKLYASASRMKLADCCVFSRSAVHSLAPPQRHKNSLGLPRIDSDSQ
jgi:hypothetical protein